MKLARRTVLVAAPTLAGCSIIKPAPLNTPYDDVFSTKSICADLAVLDAQAHLRAGGDGDFQLKRHIENRLASCGFTIQRQAVTVPAFETRSAKLAATDFEIDVFPQYPVSPTGANGLKAPLARWRPGDDTAPLRGKIALLELPCARHSRLLSAPIKSALDSALSGGPAAIVLITDGPTGETIILNAPFERPYVQIPIAVLGPKTGALAVAAAAQGANARLVIDGEGVTAESENVIGRVDRGGRYFVVSTPRTGWTPAVAERGPGIASFLAMAAWAAKMIQDHSLLFVNTTAHEFENVGGRLYLNSAAAPKPDEVALWIHFGAGFAARAFHEIGDYQLAPLNAVDPQRFLLGSDDLVPNLAAAFAGQPGLENPYPLSAGAAGELAEIARHGYAPLFGMFGAHRFHHVMHDRLAMTDPAWIKRAVLSSRTVAETILSVRR